MDLFRSKVGLGLVIPIAIILCGTFILVLVLRVWLGAVLVGCTMLFVIHLFMTTYYTISGNVLRVKSGFIINKAIDVGTITKITPTNNMLSSPALSLDRLEIFYNKYDSILISPKEKTRFVNQLKIINPAIILD